MPQGVGYRDMLSRLSELVAQDSASRSSAISDEFAQGLGQEYESPRRPTANVPVPTPGEQAIRREAMSMSTPDGDSTDELRNYALLQRSKRMGAAGGDAQNYARARDQAAEAVRGAPPVSTVGAPGPSLPGSSAVDVSPEKARLLSELEAEGNRTAAEIGAIGSKAPGTANGLSADLERRKREILARLAESAPAPMPQPQAPQLPPPGPAPAQPAPQVASALPIAPVPQQVVPAQPVATFPLIPPPIYPQVSYPTPRAPNIPALDASADYARFRLGR